MTAMKRLPFVVLLAVLFSPLVSAQEWAKKRLEDSPRHLEFVKIRNGAREVNAFLAFPEVKDRATAVVVIHEIFGLTDWVRGVCDQLAEAGYIAIAPDLLSGTAPNGGGTAELGGGDAVRKAISSLPPDQITADLKAVAAHVTQLPACNGQVATIGFCWGGGQAFRFATNHRELKAACVFYGSGPENPDDIARIQAPIHGFYAENDARIGATVPRSEQLMKAAGKKFDAVTYPGAGHGFMRAGEDPDGNEANKRARNEAWKRLKAILAGPSAPAAK